MPRQFPTLYKFVVTIPHRNLGFKETKEYYLENQEQCAELLEWVEHYNQFEPDMKMEIHESRMVCGYTAEEIRSEIGFEFNRGVEK